MNYKMKIQLGNSHEVHSACYLLLFRAQTMKAPWNLMRCLHNKKTRPRKAKYLFHRCTDSVSYVARWVHETSWSESRFLSIAPTQSIEKGIQGPDTWIKVHLYSPILLSHFLAPMMVTDKEQFPKATGCSLSITVWFPYIFYNVLHFLPIHTISTCEMEKFNHFDTWNSQVGRKWKDHGYIR